MPCPRGNRFDAESLFYDRGTADLVAKYLDGREAELFTVPLEPPSPLLRPAQPRSIGRLRGFTEPATGADLSADGTLLAVCSTAVTRVYRRDDHESPPWRLLAVVRYAALPIEGIAWDGRDLAPGRRGGRILSPLREDLAGRVGARSRRLCRRDRMCDQKVTAAKCWNRE